MIRLLMNRIAGAVMVFTFFLGCFAQTVRAADPADFLTLKFGSGVREVGTFDQDKAIGGYNCPTSFAVDDMNNIYVLDAPHFCVKVFSPQGILMKIIEYPAMSPSGVAVLCLDIAVSSEKNIYVANATQKVIWKFNAAGTLIDTIGIKADGSSCFEHLIRVTLDRKGNIYGTDRASMKIIKFGPAGDKQRVLPFNVYPVDSILMLLDYETDPKVLEIKSMNETMSDVALFARIDMKKTVLDAYPVGIDDQKHLYVFVSLGKIIGDRGKQAEELCVIEIDGNGKITRKIEVPEFSGFPMNRYFAVTGDGKLLRAETDEENYRIVEYR